MTDIRVHRKLMGKKRCEFGGDRIRISGRVWKEEREGERVIRVSTKEIKHEHVLNEIRERHSSCRSEDK